MRKLVFSALAMAGLAFGAQGQVTQDFESNDRNAIRNNCWIIWGFNPDTNGAIAGSYSARSQQLTNANDSAQLVSPYTMFNNGTGNITFSHKLDGNNGTERVLYVALFDQNGDFVQNLQTYTYRSGNVNQNGNPTVTVNGSIPVTFSGVYRIGFYATGSGGSSRAVLDEVSLPGTISADAQTTDGFGDCAPVVPAVVSQDFESGDRNAVRTDCWTIFGYDVKSNNAITGGFSARSQQLSNANDSGTFISPFISFDGTGAITFNHKLDANNGSERALYVDLLDVNGQKVQNLLTYVYRTGNTSQVGDATAAAMANIAVNFSGIYKIGIYATGSGGSSRNLIDDVMISGTNVTDANCNAILPAVVSQDFESGDRNAVRTDCWTIFGYDVKSNDAITGGFSARSQQLSNANDSGTFISPFISFDGTGAITFNHKLDANNGNERALYVDLLDVNGNKVQNLLSYVYRTGNASLVGDATVAAMANIPVTFSGNYKVAIYATGALGSSRNIIDDVMISGTNVTDANCNLIGAKEYTSSIVSDGSWSLSSVVTTATANSYPWPGVGSVPAANTFTLPVELSQPYSFVSISTVDSTEVVKAESGVTYYRKEFNLSDNTGLNVRFRMFVDDNMQIFVNGQWVALEDDMGPENFRTANHDLLIKADNSVINGNMGGDAFDYVTNVTMDNIFQVGMNEIVLAIRNRTSKPDLGGFSFRMDIDKNGNNVIEKSGEAKAPAVSSNPSALSADIYPNPTSGIINIAPSQLDLSKEVEVAIFDMSGHVVMHKSYTYNNISDMLSMNLNGLAKGVYSIKVSNGNESIVKRVVLN